MLRFLRMNFVYLCLMLWGYAWCDVLLDFCLFDVSFGVLLRLCCGCFSMCSGFVTFSVFSVCDYFTLGTAFGFPGRFLFLIFVLCASTWFILGLHELLL